MATGACAGARAAARARARAPPSRSGRGGRGRIGETWPSAAMMPSVLVLLALAATPSVDPTSGRSIFVSPSGSDDGDGTSDSPLRTLAQAQRRVRTLLAARRQPTVLEVVLRPGRYFNTSLVFTEQDSPPPGKRVTWRGDDGASVFGGCEITGWTPWVNAPAGRPILRAVLPPELVDSAGWARFNVLMEGERSVPLARAPNKGSGYLAINDSSFVNTGFQFMPGSLPVQFDCLRSRCSVFTRAGYGSNIRPVTHVNLADRRVTMVGGNTTDPAGRQGRGGGAVRPGSVVLAGALELLDAPGEWAVRGGIVYLWPLNSSSSLEQMLVTAPIHQRIFSFVGSGGGGGAAAPDEPDAGTASRITLVGLRVIGAGMPSLYVFACVAKGIEDGRGSAQSPCNSTSGIPNTTPQSMAQGMIYTENAADIGVDRCVLKGAGISAVWLQERSTNISVVDCLIADIAGHGVYLNGVGPNDTRYDSPVAADVNHGHNISGNVIVDGGKQLVLGSGVWLYQSGRNTISHNTISRFPRDCVGFYGMCCHNWNAQRAPSIPRYWNRSMSINSPHGSNTTISTYDVLFTRDNVLAWNDLSLCNREGIDGGAVESWGTGVNNTWEYNAVHDLEGPMEVMFADDFSPGLTVRRNVIFEVNNANVFMMKSLNMTVADNVVADSTWATVFYIDDYHLPASNMSALRNIVYNVSQPRSAVTSQGLPIVGSSHCNSSTDVTATKSCASYYSALAIQPDAYGRGRNFATATLREQLWYGNNQTACHSSPPQDVVGDGHCIPWHWHEFGFTEQQLATPVVRTSDRHWVDDPQRLHIGATRLWDHHSTVLQARPFVCGGGAAAAAAAPRHAWDRTAADYTVSTESPPGRGGFLGIFDTGAIGAPQALSAVVASYPRSASARLQAEDYDRRRGLWTTTALALGAPAPFVYLSGLNRPVAYLEPFCPCAQGCPPCAMQPSSLPQAIEHGSWARFDNIDFGDLSGAASVTVRARVSPTLIDVVGGAKSFGALVRFQLGDPTTVGERGRTLATLRIPAPNAVAATANSTAADQRLLREGGGAGDGWVELVGVPGDCRTLPSGLATVFAVFTLAPGSYRIGGTMDWFSFERAHEEVSSRRGLA
jgi:hypothetical protein